MLGLVRDQKAQRAQFALFFCKARGSRLHICQYFPTVKVSALGSGREAPRTLSKLQHYGENCTYGGGGPVPGWTLCPRATSSMGCRLGRTYQKCRQCPRSVLILIRKRTENRRTLVFVSLQSERKLKITRGNRRRGGGGRGGQGAAGRTARSENVALPSGM